MLVILKRKRFPGGEELLLVKLELEDFDTL